MICISITANNYLNILKQIKKANKESDLIELRVDLFNLKTKNKLKKIINACKKPVIFTLRSKKEGGKFNEKNPEKILEKLIELKPKYIDLELNLKKNKLNELIKKAKKNKVKIIASKHFFKPLTKKQLELELKKAKKIKGIDLIKLIPTAKKIENNFETLNFIIHNKKNLVCFNMGKKGIISRILSLKAGSKITFACLEKKNKSIQEQPTINELKNLLKQKHFAVIGFPVKHSLSPLMHKTAFKKKKINAMFHSIEINKKNLLKSIPVLKLFNGFNITMPLKEKIIFFLNKIDLNAKNINAVNTVIVKNKKLIGFNTDSFGAINALKKKTKIKGKKILLFGAGGAAKAICNGLNKQNNKITIINRNQIKGKKLAKKFNAKFISLKKMQHILKEKFDIIINATSIGMNSNEMIPVENFLEKKVIVMDLVYFPIKTKLIKKAMKKKCIIITGIEMLLMQGMKSFELFTGKKAPEKEMRKALLKGV